MGEETLEHTMRICIEGPQQLSEQTLEHIIDEYRKIKRRKIVFEDEAPAWEERLNKINAIFDIWIEEVFMRKVFNEKGFKVLDHVLCIDRIFKQQQSHLLLFGVSGAGKTTLSRFEVWINGLSVFEIKVHNKYTADDIVLNDLSKVEPAAKEAQQAVKGIKKSHLVEVRALNNPISSSRWHWKASAC
uniref:Dynein heavy chain AAA module D4 domain-containing protein n=2 Tax=Amphimedon queenslandica TaxID=400682 RepID=A0A1X7T449_AMPQE